MGAGVIVTSAAPGRTYQGDLIAVIDNGRSSLAVMAISDDRAILHDVKKSAGAGLETGRGMTLVTDSEGYSAVQGRDAETPPQRREGLRR